MSPCRWLKFIIKDNDISCSQVINPPNQSICLICDCGMNYTINSLCFRLTCKWKIYRRHRSKHVLIHIKWKVCLQNASQPVLIRPAPFQKFMSRFMLGCVQVTSHHRLKVVKAFSQEKTPPDLSLTCGWCLKKTYTQNSQIQGNKDKQSHPQDLMSRKHASSYK